MSRPVVIQIEGLSKTFRVPEHRVHTLKERAMHPFRRTRFEALPVLDDISLRVLEGEFFGIVGRNGSGKSTLLKCLAGIYRADTGRILVAGRLAPFIELGVGFNPDLTARENVVINAVMMGLSPAQARDRFDVIMEFAELEPFVEMKLKNYSSGMQVRLAFATMVQSDADVMLIDEVLAVGDAAFQRKCFGVFDDLRARGKTIVLVTHDMDLVERFCDRAILIEGNRIDTMGDAEAVARRYMEINLARESGAPPDILESGRLDVSDVWIAESDGRSTETAMYGAPLQLCALIEAHEPVADPEIRLWIESSEGVRVFAASTLEFGTPVSAFDPGERRLFSVRLENRLVAGTYKVHVLVRGRSDPRDLAGIKARAARFAVVGGEHVGGLYHLEHELDLTHVSDEIIVKGSRS